MSHIATLAAIRTSNKWRRIFSTLRSIHAAPKTEKSEMMTSVRPTRVWNHQPTSDIDSNKNNLALVLPSFDERT
jgi:hypothetical protein